MICEAELHELLVGYRVTARRGEERATDVFEILRGAMDAARYLQARGWETDCVEIRQLAQDGRIVNEETMPVSPDAIAALIWAELLAA